MKRRRPIPVWILIVVFTLSAAINLKYLFSPSPDLNRELLFDIGLGWLCLPLKVAALILDGAGLWFLVRPRPAGYWTVLAVLLLSGAVKLFLGVLSILNPDPGIQWYVKSREARGLPVRQEIIELLKSLPVQLAALSAVLLVSLIWIGLLVWSRRYFRPRSV